MIDVSEAMNLVEAQLATALPRRWRHAHPVARPARWVAKRLALSAGLVAAAWAPRHRVRPRTGGNRLSSAERGALPTPCGH